MERLCLNCMKIYSIKSEYEKMNGQCPYCGFDDNTPPKDGMHLPPGTILNNKYIVGTVIGAGGFGATYRGWDNTLARVVAIKEYLPKGLVVRQGKELVVKSESDYEFLQKGIKRTLMEARSIVRFNDESAITNIYEFFEENGTAYIVMEYLEGCNLRDYSKNYKEILPFDMIMNLAVSICDVLDVVHKENIVHRDISPDNIFYCSKKKIYKLIDFGAVKQVDSSYMQSSTIYLKHGFAPIEQYSGSGQVGPWTDIYAFGATLYVLSTGKMPAPSVDRIGEDSLVAPKDINSSLPIEFSDVILKAMAVQARDRFKNAGEFKNALLKCVQKNETHEERVEIEFETELDEKEKKEDHEEKYEINNIQHTEIKQNIFIAIVTVVVLVSLAIVASIINIGIINKGKENNNQLVDSSNDDTVLLSDTETDAEWNENTNPFINAHKGDIIAFGDYNKNNEWVVLERQEKKILVISKYAICQKAYNDVEKETNWEDCSLRKWLNETYYNSTFSLSEQVLIKSTFVENLHTNSTIDKIFLLSSSEVREYFTNDSERNVTLSDGTPVCWWLRTTGITDMDAVMVKTDGYIETEGQVVYNKELGVRPAMWIDISNF